MKNFECILGNTTDNEIEKLQLLLKKVFKKDFKFDYLKWLYAKNPNGKAIISNITSKGNVVGHYAVIPTLLSIDNKKYRAALSLNTAVDNKFRGRGFFKIMAEKAYEESRKHGIDFIIGVANQQSTNLFLKYFNFQNLGQLDVKFGVGKINYSENNKKFKVFWNNETLNWRIRNPKFEYKVYSKKNKIIITNKLYKFINIYMGQFNKGNSIKIDKYEKNDINFLNLYIGVGNNNWKKSLYFDLPNFLKPSPLNLIFKDISKKQNKLIPKRDEVLFQLMDFDAF